MDKKLPEGSLDLESKTSESNNDESNSKYSNKAPSIISDVDFACLSERLKKIIQEFKWRFGISQISGIKTLSDDCPLRIIYCDIDLKQSELHQVQNLSESLNFHRASVVKEGQNKIMPGRVSIFYFYGVSEYAFMPWMNFRNQSIAFYNGAEKSEAEIDDKGSEKLIGRVWIPPEYFTDENADIFRFKNYFETRMQAFEISIQEKLNSMMQEIVKLRQLIEGSLKKWKGKAKQEIMKFG